MTGEIPEDVLRFITDQIDTVPHLEALLLLWENPDHRWTDHEIATRVYVSLETGKRILNDLALRGLVSADPAAPDHYVYDSRWDPTGESMRRVAETYRRHLIRIANLIHSKASPGVREFARAFQLKKD